MNLAVARADRPRGRPAPPARRSTVLGPTSMPWAPWTIVPADSKTHRNLMIGTLVRDTLKALDLRFPAQDPAQVGLRIE